MSDQDLDPLASDLVELLDAEKARPEPGAEARARVFERLASSIGQLPPDGGGSGGDSGGGGGAPPAPAAPSGGLTQTLLAHPVALAVGTFALGGAIGAAVDHAVSKEPPQIVYVEKRVEIPTPTPTPTPSPIDTATALPTAASTATATSTSTSTSTGTGTSTGTAGRDLNLAGERALLDTAKTALGRRDYATALETLDRHAQKYPRAQLAEEREALAVQALVGLGRTTEARARAERFKKTFPGSMLTPVVDAALHNP